MTLDSLLSVPEGAITDYTIEGLEKAQLGTTYAFTDKEEEEEEEEEDTFKVNGVIARSGKVQPKMGSAYSSKVKERTMKAVVKDRKMKQLDNVDARDLDERAGVLDDLDEGFGASVEKYRRDLQKEVQVWDGDIEEVLFKGGLSGCGWLSRLLQRLSSLSRAKRLRVRRCRGGFNCNSYQVSRTFFIHALKSKHSSPSYPARPLFKMPNYYIILLPVPPCANLSLQREGGVEREGNSDENRPRRKRR